MYCSPAALLKQDAVFAGHGNDGAQNSAGNSVYALPLPSGESDGRFGRPHCL